MEELIKDFDFADRYEPIEELEVNLGLAAGRREDAGDKVPNLTRNMHVSGQTRLFAETRSNRLKLRAKLCAGSPETGAHLQIAN